MSTVEDFMNKERLEAIQSGRSIDHPHQQNKPGISLISDTLNSLRIQSARKLPTKFISSPSSTITPSVDGKYVFVANQSSIEIHNHSHLIHTINNAHNAKITSIQTLHYDKHKIITAALDGAIILWDTLDFSPIKHITYYSPISHLLVQQSQSDRNQTILFIALNKIAQRSRAADGSDRPPVINTVYYKYTWSHNKSVKKQSLLLGQTRPPTSVNLNDDILTAQCGKKLNVSQHNLVDKRSFVKWVNPEKQMQAALDPLNEFYVTSELSSGKIHLWPYSVIASELPAKPQVYSFNHPGFQNNCPTEVLHWHSHPIKALTFTPNGSFLLSGGDEGVLVRWHVRQTNGRLAKKDFLPRLGAGISYIVCNDETNWIVGLVDGSKVYVDGAQWRVDHVVRGLVIPSVPNHHERIPITNTHDGKLIFPSSHPSVLQIYDINNNTSEELEVSPNNRIVNKGDFHDNSQFNIQGRVEDVSSCRDWLATVDSASVKIWQIDQESGKYQLNTRIDKPHGDSAVTQVSWSNSSKGVPVLATIGEDRKCRLWRAEPLDYRPKALGKIKSIIREGQVSFSLFATLNYKDEEMNNVFFSPDSSLLVMVHPSTISLWNPTAVYTGKNAPSLLRVLSGEGVTLNEGVFVGSSYIAVRATAGAGEACHGVCLVYNLTNCKCIYTHSFAYTTPQILAHSSANKFALFSGATRPRMNTQDNEKEAEREKVLSKSAIATQMTTFTITNEGLIEREEVTEFDNSYFKFAFMPLSEGFNLVGLATTHENRVRNFAHSQTYVMGSAGAVLIGDQASKFDLRRDEIKQDQSGNMFEEIFGKFDDHLALFRDNEMEKDNAFINANEAGSKRTIKNLFDGPSHLLPGPEMLYGDFLEGFLPKRVNNVDDSKTTSIIYEDTPNGDIKMQEDDISGAEIQRNRHIDSSEVKLMTQIYETSWFAIIMAKTSTNEDLATKLLTMINVSASKSTQPKRIRFDNPELQKTSKKKKLSEDTEKTEKTERTEKKSPTKKKKNAQEVQDNTEEKPEETAPQEDDDEEGLDTLSSHFGPTPTNLRDELLARVVDHRWDSLPSNGPLGRCTEVDLGASPNENVYISPRFTQAKHNKDLLKLLGSYKDVLSSHLTEAEHAKMRKNLSLHIHNHLFRTRRRVLKNNEKLAHFHADDENKGKEAPECTDQGFTRPKVLILTPFRHNALEWLKDLIDNAPTSQTDNKGRLFQEFSLPKGAIDKIASSPPGTYPPDHVSTFVGNIDDNFKLGVKLTRKSFKPYAEFYSSDMILASPLGLKLAMEKSKDTDYLSSIEIVVGDKLDVITMQNWQHLTEIFENLNNIPKEGHGCDFARVKPWYLDNKARYLRQSVLMAGYETPEMRNLFNKHCNNVDGKIRTETRFNGVLGDVAEGVKSSFYRFDADNLLDEPDARFAYFKEKTLPSLKKSAVSSSSTIIFVSSYFDFVRLRNYLKASDVKFAGLSEYSTNKEISRVRTAFFKNEVNFLLRIVGTTDAKMMVKQGTDDRFSYN
ncbi:WD40 repeat-like protein [Wallemia mellicola]|nr:WD40 repeat-like protein [Wallemia mellicola]TIC58827.1 WD40 repeat-like protein [Wallemia mellicola]